MRILDVAPLGIADEAVREAGSCSDWFEPSARLRYAREPLPGFVFSPSSRPGGEQAGAQCRWPLSDSPQIQPFLLANKISPEGLTFAGVAV
jgi:hypothetical protein